MSESCTLLLLLNCCLGIISIIWNRVGLAAIQFFHRTLAQYRQSPIARDRQEPGRDATAPLESSGMTPDLEEHFAHQVFGSFLFIDQAQCKAIDAKPVFRKQNVHCVLVALCNRTYQLDL